MEDRFKDIIIESLSFLTKVGRIQVYGFVIMPNHLHMIWQMLGEHKREAVHRDFLKFTSQQILKHLRNEQSALQTDLLVHAKRPQIPGLGTKLIEHPTMVKPCF